MHFISCYYYSTQLCNQTDIQCAWTDTCCGQMVTLCDRMRIHVISLISHFSCFQTAVNNIHLVQYGDLHVQQALALVAADEAYSEVLQLEFKPREEGQDDKQPQVFQAATPNPVLDAAIMKTKDQHIEGDAPPHFPEQASYSSHASSSLCLDNQEQYLRITHYMNSRGGNDCVPVAPDGSCMFSSLRRIISAPFEYRNIHLRRQLVIMLANHKEFFFNLLKEHMRGTMGSLGKMRRNISKCTEMASSWIRKCKTIIVLVLSVSILI